VPALACLGHPVLGGALGAFGALAGVWTGPGAESLEKHILTQAASRPLSVRWLGERLLYVAWPELWGPDGPLPPAVDDPAELHALLAPLGRLLPGPAAVTRPAATPVALRSQLRHSPQTILSNVGPLPRCAQEAAAHAGAELTMLFERAGQLAAGHCHSGLLRSFGLLYEPLGLLPARPGPEAPR
jgi:hypothetical protein